MDKYTQAVVESFQQRAAAGFRKYGTTMERGDLTLHQWLTHAQEELQDFSIYAMRIIHDLEKLKETLHEAHHNGQPAADGSHPPADDLQRSRRDDDAGD
jgi:ATP-dependent protease ClpP protease subunit